MKKLDYPFLVALFSILALISACNRSSDDKKEEKRQNVESPKNSDTTATLLSAPNLLTAVHYMFLTNIEIAKATSKSNVSELRSFGERVGAEDRELLESIRTLARDKGIVLTDTLSTKTQNFIRSINEKEGADLTKAFLRGFSQEHRRLNSTMRTNRGIEDKEISAFIKETRAVLRSQGDELRVLRKSLLGTGNRTDATKQPA
jgi:predicted outer membrane protein